MSKTACYDISAVPLTRAKGSAGNGFAFLIEKETGK